MFRCIGFWINYADDIFSCSIRFISKLYQFQSPAQSVSMDILIIRSTAIIVNPFHWRFGWNFVRSFLLSAIFITEFDIARIECCLSDIAKMISEQSSHFCWMFKQRARKGALKIRRKSLKTKSGFITKFHSMKTLTELTQLLA